MCSCMHNHQGEIYLLVHVASYNKNLGHILGEDAEGYQDQD